MSIQRASLLFAAALIGGCYPEQDPSRGNEGGALTLGGRSTGAAYGGRTATRGGAGGETQISPDLQGGTDAHPDPMTGGMVSSGGAGGVGSSPSIIAPPPGNCTPPRSSLSYPQRGVTMSDEAQSPDLTVYVSDIYKQFELHCGSCHVTGNSGGFKVVFGTFSKLVDDKVLSIIESDDPAVAMPQGLEGEGTATGLGRPFSTRAPNDPIVALAKAIREWLDHGAPADSYQIPNPDYGKTSPYLMTEEVGMQMTNIGSCIPDKDFPVGIGTDIERKMDELDAKFAELSPKPLSPSVSPAEQIGLPQLLSETDLFTLDSAVLARYGVVAYAPTYPLWSDGSAKLRYIRVPRGKTITFNQDKQEFSIPPNTRFYKTFMKEVRDRSTGKMRYRKIETRLIVARPDLGTQVPGALFGTYVWNEDETQAELLTDVRRDLTPFSDRVKIYYTDEPKADAIANQDPPPQNLTYELQAAGVIRHYALPGAERCRECHIGSVRNDFVLGFTPMQVMRRRTNDGGTIEPTGPDELTQLERLTALGIVDLSYQSDILPLEYSQGNRLPRNDWELKAQGYMFGNCGHCHNPNGYATATAPQLLDLLRFWPDKRGGVFQYPLERFSPRISRGEFGRKMPYITPSLRDLLPFGYNRLPITIYKPKFFDANDPENPGLTFIDAPWRSLIYRNTHTPFTYADDYAIFPHMPMNTAGHDCTASRLFGTWMTSIPARKKSSVKNLSEDEVDWNAADEKNAYPGAEHVDSEAQPYEEVKPWDADYDRAVAEATQRVQTFQNGIAYQNCPDTSDIIDPVLATQSANNTGSGIPTDNVVPQDNVPDHAHFVSTDLTEPPGAWSPRRSDWEDVLVRHNIPSKGTGTDALKARDLEVQLVSMLTDNGGVSLKGELKSFLSEPFPLAEWETKSTCDLASQKHGSDFKGDARPRWMDISAVADTAPIFSKVPGGIIYDEVCINCHGPKLDSLGRQADTVQLLTGGNSRVANFIKGLFGPPESPGTNRAQVFEHVAKSGLTTDDWAARYLTWMALGGTSARIPSPVLQLVGRTEVAGATRNGVLLDSSQLSANMLAAAESACGWVILKLQGPPRKLDFTHPSNYFGIAADETFYSLILSNGEAEMWERLCTLNNPPPLRAIVVGEGGTSATLSHNFFYEASKYPATARVGNHRGKIVVANPSGQAGIAANNLAPWCILYRESKKDDVQNFREAHKIDGELPPLCPTDVASDVIPSVDDDYKSKWARRGAVNAGFAVFSYVDQVTRGVVQPVRYNECELLQK